MDPEAILELTDEELQELRENIEIEQERRRTIRNAEAISYRINEQYTNAIGREDGDDWTQPTGAHDAYRKGAVVTHNEQEWESTTSNNVWEPGVSGWRLLAPIDPETGERGVAEWVQPTGTHDAYQKGDRVLFEGEVWESIIDNNTWSPRDYPQGWEVVKSEEETPTNPPEDEPVEPEEPSVPEWVRPLGAHDAYQKGDRVLFEGEVWESVISNNTWSPTEYPQGWQKIQ